MEVVRSKRRRKDPRSSVRECVREDGSGREWARVVWELTGFCGMVREWMGVAGGAGGAGGSK